MSNDAELRGPHFSQACTRVWNAIVKRDWTLADVEARLPGWDPAHLRRILFGDEPASIPEALALFALFGMNAGMKAVAWTRPAAPTWRFPPIARAAR